MTQAIQNVSDTAFMVAGFRALEAERPQPLFRDPLAWKLAGDQGRKILATIPPRFVGAWSVVIRTVIIDAFIHQAIEAGRQNTPKLIAGRRQRRERPGALESSH